MSLERLWAPWRTAYLTSKRKGCFLCDCAKARDGRKKHVVQRTPHSFSVLNIYPYNNGHLMVVPRRHVRDLAELSGEEKLDLLELFSATKALLEKVLKPHGFNAGINFGRAGGAGLEGHLHIHIVPRWVGDTNFMPVTGNTKVISQSLAALYAHLVSAASRRRRKSG